MLCSSLLLLRRSAQKFCLQGLSWCRRPFVLVRELHNCNDLQKCQSSCCHLSKWGLWRECWVSRESWMSFTTKDSRFLDKKEEGCQSGGVMPRTSALVHTGYSQCWYLPVGTAVLTCPPTVRFGQPFSFAESLIYFCHLLSSVVQGYVQKAVFWHSLWALRSCLEADGLTTHLNALRMKCFGQFAWCSSSKTRPAMSVVKHRASKGPIAKDWTSSFWCWWWIGISAIHHIWVASLSHKWDFPVQLGGTLAKAQLWFFWGNQSDLNIQFLGLAISAETCLHWHQPRWQHSHRKPATESLAVIYSLLCHGLSMQKSNLLFISSQLLCESNAYYGTSAAQFMSAFETWMKRGVGPARSPCWAHFHALFDAYATTYSNHLLIEKTLTQTWKNIILNTWNHDMSDKMMSTCLLKRYLVYSLHYIGIDPT